MFEAPVDQLVFDFNLRPDRYVQADWLDTALRVNLERLRNTPDPCTRRHLLTWLRQALDLPTEVDFAMPKRVLLLDAAALIRLARLVGLAAITHELRTRIRGDAWQALQTALGEDDLEYFVAKMLPAKQSIRVKLSDEQTARLDAPNELLSMSCRLGARLMLSSCDTPDSSSVRRARLKFPRALSGGRQTLQLSEARRAKIADYCVNTLVQERLPQWHWLFSS
jgi:YOP proteins translocation protein K (YscK)